MAGTGGARPGAGRKKKKDKFARPIARAEKQICDHLPELIDLQMSRARGVLLVNTEQEVGALLTMLQQEFGDNDDVRSLKEKIEQIFTREPDERALEYLINRIMGKPTERKEVTGEDGGPVQTRIIIGPMENDTTGDQSG
jgi:hypothetical protein